MKNQLHRLQRRILFLLSVACLVLPPGRHRTRTELALVEALSRVTGAGSARVAALN